MRRKYFRRKEPVEYPLLEIPGGGRAKLLELALDFVLQARRLPGITRIGLLGSITTDKPDPFDVDLLVTVEDDIDLAPLAKLGRKIQGAAGSVGRGADVFLADPAGNYIGRTCHWVECEPFRRVSCRAWHCGKRHYLYDDFGVLKLAQSLVKEPPVELFPEIVVRVNLPADVEKLLLLPLKS